MDFIIYNAENSPHTKVKPGKHTPNITVCRNGGIVLNSHLLKLLEQPERVVIMEDKRYPGDFYIMPMKDPGAFTLEQPDKRGARRFLSSSLVEHMVKSIGVQAPFIVDVSEDGRKIGVCTVHALAVKKARPVNRKAKKANQQ